MDKSSIATLDFGQRESVLWRNMTESSPSLEHDRPRTLTESLKKLFDDTAEQSNNDPKEFGFTAARNSWETGVNRVVDTLKFQWESSKDEASLARRFGPDKAKELVLLPREERYAVLVREILASPNIGEVYLENGRPFITVKVPITDKDSFAPESTSLQPNDKSGVVLFGLGAVREDFLSDRDLPKLPQIIVHNQVQWDASLEGVYAGGKPKKLILSSGSQKPVYAGFRNERLGFSCVFTDNEDGVGVLLDKQTVERMRVEAAKD